MQAQKEFIHELLGSGPWRDQRAALRYPSTLSAYCQAGDEQTCSARVWNISQSGVCLIINRLLAPGTPVAVTIEVGPEQNTVPLSARVVHVTDHIPGLWIAGCAFDECLTEEQLDALM